MWMSADNHINTLLHQESSPLFLVFIWHGFIFCSPVGDEDNAVADFFGLLDHCGDLVFVKDIEHIFVAVADTGIIGAICIVKESNLDSIDFFYFYRICVFLSGVVQEYPDSWCSRNPECFSGNRSHNHLRGW